MNFFRQIYILPPLAACCFVSGCTKPIGNVADLNGCYFAKGSTPLFEIRQSKLVSPEITSAVAIPSSTSDSSVISFDPGIEVTENERKSMIVVQGPEISGLAFERRNKRYILLSAGGISLQLDQRDCPSSNGVRQNAR